MLHNLTTSLFNSIRSTGQRLQAACAEPIQRLEGRVMLASDRDIVATADFNGDDRQDIVVYRRNAGRNGGGQLRVLLNTGDGYERADTIAVGRVADVAVGDFNNDGDLDLVIAQKTNLEAVNKRGKARKGVGDESGGNNAGGGNGGGNDGGNGGGNNGGGVIIDGPNDGGGTNGGGNASGGNNSGGGNGGGDLCDNQLRPSGLRLLATVRDPVDGDGDLDDEDPDPAPPLGGGSAGTGGDDSDEENDGDDNNNGVEGDDNVSEDGDDDDNDRDNNGIDDDDRGTARGPRDTPRRPRRGGRVSDPRVRDDDNTGTGGSRNGNGSNGNDSNRDRRRSGSNNRRRVAASQVLIALGNGNGTFDPAQSVTSATLFGVSRIRVGDFNNDGNDDLRVRARNTNSKGKPLADGGRHVWITFNGEGDGTFSRSSDDVTA